MQAFAGAVIVRSGPGQDYDRVGEIAYLDVRPIIGRSTSSPWWQIALDGDTRIAGWVADEFVVVSGYTGAVPVLPSPALPTGDTPTPGAAWDPTPNPICTPPPTATDTPAAPTDTPAPTATELPPAATNTDTAPAAEEAEALAESAQPEATTTAVSPPTKIPEAAKQPAPTAAPLGTDLATGSTNSLDIWLPLMGVGLVLAGVILLFVRRR